MTVDFFIAVKDTAYTLDDITLITLENVLFTGKVNDIAFIAGNTWKRGYKYDES